MSYNEKEELMDSMKDLLYLAKCFVQDAEHYILLAVHQMGKDDDKWTETVMEALRALECAFEDIEEARSKLYDLREKCKEHASTETEEETRS